MLEVTPALKALPEVLERFGDDGMSRRCWELPSDISESTRSDIVWCVVVDSGLEDWPVRGLGGGSKISQGGKMTRRVKTITLPI